jgi:hypothetical protein
MVLPHRIEDVGAAVDEFLTEELYHERANAGEIGGSAEISQLAGRTYDVFIEICTRGENKGLLGQLDTARVEFEALCRSAETKMITECAAPGPTR